MCTANEAGQRGAKGWRRIAIRSDCCAHTFFSAIRLKEVEDGKDAWQILGVIPDAA